MNYKLRTKNYKLKKSHPPAAFNLILLNRNYEHIIDATILYVICPLTPKTATLNQ